LILTFLELYYTSIPTAFIVIDMFFMACVGFFALKY